MLKTENKKLIIEIPIVENQENFVKDLLWELYSSWMGLDLKRFEHIINSLKTTAEFLNGADETSIYRALNQAVLKQNEIINNLVKEKTNRIHTLSGEKNDK